MIALGSDHAGFRLKEEVRKHLEEKGVAYKDFGVYAADSCDYPRMAVEPCRAVLRGECARAILFCGTGIGISMAANKIKGIRAAACSDAFSAQYTRLHNDANALCLGERVVGPGLACQLVDLFLEGEFEGGRHGRRVEQIMALESETIDSK